MRSASTLLARLAVAVLAATASWVGLPLAPAAAAGATFVVTSTADGADAAINGVCATTAGQCTLRAALQEANRSTTAARVEFAIPGTGRQLIQVSTRLPEMSNPLGITVDGYTQPGAAPNTAAHGSNATIMVQVKGLGAGAINGFYVTGPNNTIRGLSIYDFKTAVWVVGDLAERNSFVGNFVCTDAAGTWGAGAVNGGAAGILLDTGPSFNGIGVPASYTGAAPVDLADRNVISGCAHRGIIISNKGSTFNQVRNNLLGLTPDGSAANPNWSHAVDVNYNSQDNIVGGRLPNEANVVSGNIQEGIEVSHGPNNRRNAVIGNFVGTDITGTQVLPWTGNGMMGLRLEGEKDCDPCAPNAGFAEFAYNVVVGNGGGLQVDKGQQRNNVHDNWIGVFPDGRAAGNLDFGIRVEHGAVDNVFARNVVAYNAKGIQVIPTASQPPSSFVLPVLRNTFTQNSVYDNGGLGIDLAPLNNPNVGGTGDPAVQQNVQAPVVRAIAANGTSVTVTTCPGCTVELFDTGKVAGTYTGLSAFGQGRTYLGSAVADTAGTAVVALGGTPIPGGTVVAATTTDLDRNTSEFSRIVQFVGAQPPVVTSAGPVRYTNKGAVQMLGTGTVFDSVSLAVTDGTATTNASASVGEDGTWATAMDLSALGDGTLTLTATSTNPAGAVSTPVTLPVDKRTVPLAPLVTTAGPATATNRAAVPVAGGGDPNVTVDLSLTDGVSTATGSAGADATGAWTATLDATALSDGPLTLTATATDVSGTGPSATSTLTKLTVATVPAFTAAGPADVVNRAAVPVSGTGGPDDTIALVVTDGTSQALASTTVALDGTWSTTVDTSALADGTLTVRATATTVLGSAAGPVSTTMVKATAAPMPVFTTTGPATGPNVTAVPFAGTAQVASTVGLSVSDGVTTRTASAVTDASGTWSTTVDLTALADGTLTVSAVATNGVDAPSAPASATFGKSALALAPAVTGTSSTGVAVTVNWSPTTDSRGLPVTGYRVAVTGPAGTTTADLASTAVTYTKAALVSDTPYTVEVRAVTSAGAGAPATVAVRTKIATKLTVVYTGPTSVPAGTTLTMTGRLTNAATGVGLATAPITLNVYDVNNVKTKVPVKIVTDASGGWTARFVVPKTGTYRAVYQGATGIAGTTSLPTAKITVL